MRGISKSILGLSEGAKQVRLAATVASLGKVKDQDSLVVQGDDGAFNSYLGATPDQLRQIFPGKPIYAWSDNIGWAIIDEE